ncbi:MAG: acyl-CoA dehydrogenase family protein [Deltaproteobacteria bacterium]|nr:acyl-CoA dehydrogenase family protein [Deltaproteobacteria bacterium]MBW2695808.1 acyl-CoA dehydrogenase family protein [Deltaproteobacteria bacterium]
MDFAIDDATRKRLDVAREWGRKVVRPVGIEADVEGRPIPVGHPFFERCIERGEGRTRWGGPGSPPATGGSVIATLLLAEELAYWDRGVMIATPGPGLPEQSVLGIGTEEQKERFLGPFLDPDRPRWACFAMTEPSAGSDAAAIRTLARKDGDHWVLNGAKCFIGGASRADWILVQASVDPTKGRAAQRAFFVERGVEGLGPFKIEKKMGLKAYESTSFSLQDVRVPAANLLGGEERYERKAGFKAAMQTFNAGRPIIAANAVGMARAVLDESIRFAREHDLLGQDRVRDRVEVMARKTRMARLMCLRAGWLADQHRANIVEASMSKAVAAQVCQEAATLGTELLGLGGGRGDHLIEKLYRDAKAMDIVEGTGQIQRMIIARQLVGLPR